METKRVYFLYCKNDFDEQFFIKGYYAESDEVLIEYLTPRMNMKNRIVVLAPPQYQHVRGTCENI